jgi:hypothetical protein
MQEGEQDSKHDGQEELLSNRVRRCRSAVSELVTSSLPYRQAYIVRCAHDGGKSSGMPFFIGREQAGKGS